MRAKEFIIESSQQTTLAQLYNGNYPDRDETFWDYVSPSEFNTPLDIQTLARHIVMITLLSSGIFLMFSQASIPSISGIMTSIIISCGNSFLAFTTASFPLVDVTI